jgi:hypothetical protein
MRQALRNLFDLYDTYGKVVLALALVGLASSAAMAFFFGISVSLMHGIFLIVVSIGFALGPHLAHKVWLKGARTSAVMIGLLCVPLGVVEWYSHNGYTAGLRGVDIGDAKVQQAKYQSAHVAVDDDKTNLEMWRKRLAALETEHAWAASVTADALRAQLTSANLAIDLEAKRGGCKAKCLARTKERDDIATKIALAEEKADLTKKIEATRNVLAKARDKADTTEFKHSAAAQQATSIAKLVSMVVSGSLNPTDIQAEVVEQGANVGMSIAAMLQPALFFFIAGFFMVGIRETKWAASGPEPAPTQMTKMRSSFRDSYNRHCRTYGVAPVAA